MSRLGWLVSVGLAALVVYPYLPGRFDPLAQPLSLALQAAAVFASIGLAPVGIVSLLKVRGTMAALAARFAVGATVGTGLVAVVVAAVTGGLLLAGLVLALAIALRVARVRRGGAGGRETPTPVPILGPALVVLAAQLVVAGPMTDAARRRAVASAAPLIAELARHHERHGHYPPSLEAVWPDYATGVVAVPQYRYALSGASYSLGFEQPRFLLDDVGVREFVVYSPTGEAAMISHASWRLLLSPAEQRQTPGWHAVRNGPRPGWQIFLFD